MPTKTELCNIALSNLGETILISDIETDQSASAKKCRTFLSMAIQGSMADFPWSFARGVKDLALLSGEESEQYEYVYSYPQDCLEPRSIVIPNTPIGLYYRYYPYFFYGEGYGIETAPPEFLRPNFVKGLTADGKNRTILTNFEDARLLYTKNMEDEIQLWPNAFFEAVCWKMTAYLAMPVAQSPALAEQARQTYSGLIQIAGAQDFRGENSPNTPLPETMTSRLI